MYETLIILNQSFINFGNFGSYNTWHVDTMDNYFCDITTLDLRMLKEILFVLKNKYFLIDEYVAIFWEVSFVVSNRTCFPIYQLWL